MVFCIVVVWIKEEFCREPNCLAKQACASHLLDLLIENSSKFLKLLPEEKLGGGRCREEGALLLKGDELQGTL